MRDYFHGYGASKNHPAWAESESETGYFLSHLATPGSVVCDPCGGSSTPLAVTALSQACPVK
jgi:hypothetical protein